MISETYKNAYGPALSDAVTDGIRAQARAIAAGANDRTALQTATQRLAGKPRKHVAFMTVRNKQKGAQRARDWTASHANYMDRIQRIMCELSALICYHDTLGCRGRKKLRGRLHSLRNALLAQLDRPAM